MKFGNAANRSCASGSLSPASDYRKDLQPDHSGLGFCLSMDAHALCSALSPSTFVRTSRASQICSGHTGSAPARSAFAAALVILVMFSELPVSLGRSLPELFTPRIGQDVFNLRGQLGYPAIYRSKDNLLGALFLGVISIPQQGSRRPVKAGLDGDKPSGIGRT